VVSPGRTSNEAQTQAQAQAQARTLRAVRLRCARMRLGGGQTASRLANSVTVKTIDSAVLQSVRDAEGEMKGAGRRLVHRVSQLSATTTMLRHAGMVEKLGPATTTHKHVEPAACADQLLLKHTLQLPQRNNNF
jgi:hypothetical protein